jgi:hypothetical protein
MSIPKTPLPYASSPQSSFPQRTRIFFFNSHLRHFNSRKLIVVVLIGTLFVMISLSLPHPSSESSSSSGYSSTAAHPQAQQHSFLDSYSPDSSRRAGFAKIIADLFGSARSAFSSSGESSASLSSSSSNTNANGRLGFSLGTLGKVVAEQDLKLDDPWDAPLPAVAGLKERLGRLRAIGLPASKGGKGDLQPYEWVNQNLNVSSRKQKINKAEADRRSFLL